MNMAAITSGVNSKEEKGGTFLCQACGLVETYQYYGRKPPFHKGVTFLEDCYLLRDPFQSDSGGSFLLLGAECTACGRVVCQATTCSIFYTKRFCLNCATATIEEFPTEMHQRIKKGLLKSS